MISCSGGGSKSEVDVAVHLCGKNKTCMEKGELEAEGLVYQWQCAYCTRCSNILGTNKLCFGNLKQVYALCGVNTDWENFQRT